MPYAKCQMLNYMFVLLFIIAYLLGSIPTGYLIVKKKKGIDIKKVGSGAIGGTNVARVLGIKYGILVSLLDVLKAYFPVLLATKFLCFGWQLTFVAFAPVLGHIFPVFLKFKGGKGMSTMVGSLFALFGWKFILIVLLYAFLYFSVFQIASLFSLTFSSALPLICYLFFPNPPSVFLGIFLLLLIWWAHRENIQRIKTGEEHRGKLDFSKWIKKS